MEFANGKTIVMYGTQAFSTIRVISIKAGTRMCQARSSHGCPRELRTSGHNPICGYNNTILYDQIIQLTVFDQLQPQFILLLTDWLSIWRNRLPHNAHTHYHSLVYSRTHNLFLSLWI